MKEQRSYAAKAFVSCSLRQEDKGFVDYICRVLEAYNIQPFGTVGKFAASPENPVVLMNKNIPLADLVVICATPRYIQKDIVTGVISKGLPDMVLLETGMAIAHGKPVVVFVQEGTDVGHGIPNITQYITLNRKPEDFTKKKHLISSILKSACDFVDKEKSNKTLKTIGKVAVGGLAIYGGAKLLHYIFKNIK